MWCCVFGVGIYRGWRVVWTVKEKWKKTVSTIHAEAAALNVHNVGSTLKNCLQRLKVSILIEREMNFNVHKLKPTTHVQDSGTIREDLCKSRYKLGLLGFNCYISLIFILQ